VKRLAIIALGFALAAPISAAPAVSLKEINPPANPEAKYQSA
jgi:hypothetical protein